VGSVAFCLAVAVSVWYLATSSAPLLKEAHANTRTIVRDSSQIHVEKQATNKVKQWPVLKRHQPQLKLQMPISFVHVLKLFCDDVDEFLPFVSRSLGCKALQSCCLTSHCNACPSLHQHPCQSEDAMKPVNDSSAFNALLMKHPVRRVMACFVTAGRYIHRPCCRLPSDVANAVAEDKMTLKDFVTHHWNSNVMTKALAGDTLHSQTGAVTQNQFEKAKSVLMNMDFVGLREYLPQSAQLFAAQLKLRGEFMNCMYK
jgi:hypothetical protein